MKSDSEIQQDVLRELGWDTRVDETEVGVSVNEGVVTLSGIVNSFRKRKAAEEAAHRVSGVLDVANNLEVKPIGSMLRTDSEIASAVRHALEWDALVPDSRIRTTVTDGIVTLQGDVELWAQREDAEAALHNLVGVRGVRNEIVIKPLHPAPYDLRDAIEGALSRQAQREAQRIKLEISGGAVDLSGTVRSWAERDAVVGAAKGTRGVYRVVDHLKIQPYSI